MEFRGYREALEYVKRNKVSNNSFVSVHGKRMKVSTLKKMDWTSKIKLKRGELTEFGYHAEEPARVRRDALLKAVKKYGYSSVIKKLNIIANFNKYRDPSLWAIYRSDMAYLERLKRE